MSAFRIVTTDRLQMGDAVEFCCRFARFSMDDFTLGPFNKSCLKDGFLAVGEVDTLRQELERRYPSLEVRDEP